MLKPWQFWSLTIIAAAGVLLVFTNMVVYSQNRSTQAEVAGRGQYIQQSVQLQSLYHEIVKALADLSVRKQDKSLADVLARQGISVTINAPAVAATAADSAADTGKKGSRR